MTSPYPTTRAGWGWLTGRGTCAGAPPGGGAAAVHEGGNARREPPAPAPTLPPVANAKPR